MQEMDIPSPYIDKIPVFSETAQSGNHYAPAFPGYESENYCEPDQSHYD